MTPKVHDALTVDGKKGLILDITQRPDEGSILIEWDETPESQKT